MAARKNRGVDKLPDCWKEKIRAAALMNRLNDCALGDADMTSAQLKAADIILKKLVPDLARTDIKHEGQVGVTVSWPLSKSNLDA